MNTGRWIAAAAAAGMWAFAAVAYPDLPERVPTHWSFSGEVDGWTSKPLGPFVLPLLATALLALLALVPRVDPRRENLRRFAPELRLMVAILVLVTAALQVGTLGHALGWPVDSTTTALAGMGAMLAGLGNYLPRTRSNWFIGIRTPWTMDSERVWRETHRVGGRLFVVAGLLLLVAAFTPAGVRPWLLGPAVALAVVFPVAYSYVAWRREGTRPTPPPANGDAHAHP